MPRTRSTPGPRDSFFAKYLAGENPLTEATARALYDIARVVFQIEPWRQIAGDDVILLELEPGHAPVYASLMGNGGDVFAIKFYENAASQNFLHDLLEGAAAGAETFVHRRQVLSLEFVERSELTAPDRELLTAMGHGKAPLYPQFRAGRPGSHDWYLTEEEGERLLQFLQAVLFVLTEYSPAQIEAVIERAGWPVIRRQNDKFTLEIAPEPERPKMPAEPVALPSPALVEKLRGVTGRLGTVEMEALLTMNIVGEKYERPAFLSVALAVDAESGAILAPQVGTSAKPLANLLTELLAMVASATGSLPSTIHHAGSLRVIEPLLDALGIRHEVRRRLPAFQEAAAGMREFLGQS